MTKFAVCVVNLKTHMATSANFDVEQPFEAANNMKLLLESEELKPFKLPRK